MFIFTCSADIKHCFIPCTLFEKKSVYVFVAEGLIKLKPKICNFIKKRGSDTKVFL